MDIVRTLVATLFAAAPLAVSATAEAVCPNPAAVIPGTTSTGFYFLSQVGGCDCLASFLAGLTFSPHSSATLVIDQSCTVTQTLTVPRRMTIAGVGMEGQGVLYFPNLRDEQPAITIGPQAVPNQDAYVTIRDLNIVGPGAGGSPPAGRGIELIEAHITKIERVRIAGFRYGVWGNESYSVSINDSNVSNNRQNVRLNLECNTWRLRDNILSRAYGWSVYVAGPNDTPPVLGSNDLLLDGNRFESNAVGAVRLGSHSAMLTHNRFESNNGVGVRIDASGVGNRLITNVFSSDLVQDLGVDTVCEFSTGSNPGC
jgi:hypothetical protein